MNIDSADRGSAAGVYNQYKAPFLETITGAKSKKTIGKRRRCAGIARL